MTARVDLRLHNMHGPTVHSEDNWSRLPDLVQLRERLTSPTRDYRIVATVDNRTYEIIPLNETNQ